jgi:hypothetical protein
MRLWPALVALGLLPSPALMAAHCTATSPSHTVALVELYTSEGCSSCPPADRWLSGLRDEGFGAGQIAPLALHVDYWNYLGWSDPFSQPQFSARQREIAQRNRQRVVYTPQVVLQGEDFRAWSSRRFAQAVQAINQRPARAVLGLSLSLGDDAATLALKGAVTDAGARSTAQVFLALHENQLSTQVPAGENAGRTLRHDHVVRVWFGPFQVGGDGRIDLTRSVQLDRRWQPARLGATAFVQDAASGDVLQAIALAACR